VFFTEIPLIFRSCAASSSALNYYRIKFVASFLFITTASIRITTHELLLPGMIVNFCYRLLTWILLFSYIWIPYPLNFIFVYRPTNQIFNTFKNFKRAAIDYCN
jgi:hypothetical protein